MSRYYVKVFTDDSNEKEWEDLNPDEIHHIDFKGKRYDEVRHGKWEYGETKHHIGDGYLLGAGYRCSVCHKPPFVICGTLVKTDYCPWCGALMTDDNATQYTECMVNLYTETKLRFVLDECIEDEKLIEKILKALDEVEE